MLRCAEAPARLLPHRPPLLLLDAIQETSAEGCRASMVVAPGAWYLQADGTLPAWFGLELMAQTIGAYSGSLRRSAGQEPRVGFLLGTQTYACDQPAFPAGSRLEVEVRVRFADPAGLGAFDCRLSCDGRLVARSTLKVFEEP